ncbi:hypothetical protein [Actinocatenispora rupis]|nr:hypothetical protein [Actinocatenispora rupis]
MATLITRHNMSVSAEDPAIALDSYPPLDTHIGPVIGNALRDIAATDTGVVYISTIQNMAHILVTVEVWDTEPKSDPAREGWHVLPTMDVEWPTRAVMLRAPYDVAGPNASIELPTTGLYRVSVAHRGRDEASERDRQLNQRLDALSLAEIRQVTSEYHDLEQYLIRMWRHAAH